MVNNQTRLVLENLRSLAIRLRPLIREEDYVHLMEVYAEVVRLHGANHPDSVYAIKISSIASMVDAQAKEIAALKETIKLKTGHISANNKVLEAARADAKRQGISLDEWVSENGEHV